MGFLKLIGAVSMAEHKELRGLLTTVSRERNDALIAAGEADERFKLAISDLAKSREEVAAYKEGAKALHRGIDDAVAELKDQKGLVSSLTEKNVELCGRIETLKGEIAALRPDAEKYRAKLDRDRNRVRPSRAKAPTKVAK